MINREVFNYLRFPVNGPSVVTVDLHGCTRLFKIDSDGIRIPVDTLDCYLCGYRGDRFVNNMPLCIEHATGRTDRDMI